MTDDNSCTSSEGQGAVTINSLPSVSVNSPSACDGSNVTVTATASGGSGTYSTYSWVTRPGGW